VYRFYYQFQTTLFTKFMMAQKLLDRHGRAETYLFA
jgi:hypothetical protein